MGTNPYTAGIFYQGSFVTSEFVQAFSELLVDRRLAILAEISARPQVSQLVIQRTPYVTPSVENYQAGAYSYFRVTSPGGVLTGTTTPFQMANRTDQYVNTAYPPRSLLFTDSNLGNHYVTSNASNVLSSSSTQPAGVPLDRIQFVGEYLEMIAEDGTSIYRVTVSATNVISCTLNRTEPQRALPIRVSNGHPSPFDGTNLWIEGLVSIGDVAMSIEPYMGGYAGVSIPRVSTVSLQLSDEWFTYLIQQSWDTRSIEIKIGLTDEDIGQYRVIMRAKTERAEANIDMLDIVLRDQSLLFDRSMQDNTYVGSGGFAYEGNTEVAGVLKPLVFGFVRHITPLLIFDAHNVYQVHDGPVLGLFSVHSGGALLTDLDPDGPGVLPGHVHLMQWAPTAAEVAAGGYRLDKATGIIRLAARPSAPITVSIWGDTALTKETCFASEICKAILAKRVPEANINENEFDEFQQAQGGGMGIYIKDEMSVREAINTVLQPLGAIMRVDALGNVGVQRLHARAPVAILGEHNLLEDAMPSRREPPKAGKTYRIAHYKNWTILKQSDMLANAGILVSTFLQREYNYKVLTWYGSPNTRLPTYDSAETITLPTLCDNAASASELAAYIAFRDHSLQNLYECTAIGFAFQIQVGDTVLFQLDTLGTKNVKTGIVVEVIEKSITSNQEDLTQLLIWA